MFGLKRTSKKDDYESVKAEVQKLVDAGLVCIYDGDRLRLTDYGLQVAEQLREEERSAAKARFRSRSARIRRRPGNNL